MRATQLLSGTALVATLVAGAALFAPVQAQSSPTDTSAVTSTQEAAWLSIRDLLDRLEAQGYSDFTEVERDDGRYEVKAKDAQGQRVELDVHPVTAEVLKTEVKRDKR